MPEALFERTVIIGNSGSGKSVLARSLAASSDTPVVDLDQLHWDVSGIKRDEELTKHLVHEAAAAPRWIIEGVYGWLAEVALPRATALIWLDLPWRLCRGSLLARGSRGRDTEADFADVLEWAEAYWDRQTPSSFAGHLHLFESFAGAKFRLRARQEVIALLARCSALNDYRLRPVVSRGDWDAYHCIRRAVLFEARGRAVLYDPDHPDERLAGNQPLLLAFRGEPIGTVRLDRGPDGSGIVRLVAIDQTRQHQGHGRALLALLEEHAKRLGMTRLDVNADKDAVVFYERGGFTMVDAERESPLMQKFL